MEGKSKGLFNKFLDRVERVGNKLPHPATIFFIFAVMVVIISHFAFLGGVEVTFKAINKDHQLVDKTVKVVSLLTPDGIRWMFKSIVKNFTGFTPLGMVLVAMFGVGVAEETGLLTVLLRKLVLSAPRSIITAVIVFAGVMSNIAADAGYVVLVPLGALIFLSFGRHPLAGLAAGFAGVSGGFSANLLIGTLDPLLGGISTEAARLLDPNYTVFPTANYYFMAVSCILITIVGTVITEKIVEPRLGKYEGDQKVEIIEITSIEQRGLRAAGLSLLVFLIFIGCLTVPENGILRNPVNHSLTDHSPLMDSMVAIISLGFMIPGIFYGIFSKKIKSDKDIIKGMKNSMASMSGYISIVFFASQFIAYFKYSNLGTILAVNGADFLKETGFTGLPLVIAFILLSAFMNLFMGSASAKWTIMAPIFVPMFMGIGFAPEFTQVVYRIGDSTTNIITPLMSNFATVIAFGQRYNDKLGIGTLISMMLPYTILFMILWTILLIVWYMLNLPLGPDGVIHLTNMIL